MGQQSHFERVRRLVSGQSGVPEAEITPETRLVEDLGIDGDDGHELLEAFANEFDIDMSGMVSINYFDDEGIQLPVPSLLPLLSSVSTRIRRHVRHAARGRRVLTVRKLVASARAQHWITPELRRARGPDQLTWFNGILAGLALLATAWFGIGALIDLSLGGLLLSAALGFTLILRLRHDLAWLRRLDAAASFEERRPSAED